MSQPFAFFVFQAAPVVGYEPSLVILSAVDRSDAPSFEQILFTPGRDPLVSSQVYSYSGFSAERAWDQQVREAEHALDGIRMELFTASRSLGVDPPGRSPVEPVEQRVLLHLWLQQEHRSAIEKIAEITQSEHLRAFLQMVMSLEVQKD